VVLGVCFDTVERRKCWESYGSDSFTILTELLGYS
jgi:hypothetical protein